MTKRTLQRLILSVVALIAALIVLPIITIQFLNWNKHRNVIASWAGGILEREVEISEFLDLQLWPTPRLEIQGLRVSSPRGGFDAPLLEVGRASVEVEFVPILSGALVLDHLEVENAHLALQVAADGTANWNLGNPNPTGKKSSGPLTVVVREAKVQSSRASFVSPRARFNQNLFLHDLKLSLPEGREDSKVALIGVLNGEPLELGGAITVVGVDDVDVAFDLMLGATTGGINGRVSDVFDGGNADLALDLKTSDLARTVKMVVPGLSPRSIRLLQGHASATATMRGWLNKDVRLEQVDVITDSELVRLTASGDLNLLHPEKTGFIPSSDFNVLLETEALQQLVSEFNGVMPFPASAQAQGTLSGGLGAFRLEGVEFVGKGEFIEVSGNGRMENLGSSGGAWLDFSTSARTSDFGRVASAYGLDLPFSGQGSAQARVRGSRGAVMVDEIVMTLSSDVLSLQAGGVIGPLGPGAQYQLQFDSSVENLKALVARYGLEFPAGVTGRAAGVLKGIKTDLHARDLEIVLESETTRVDASGTIGPLGPALHFNMPIKARTNDLGALAIHLGKPLPFSGQGNAQGILVGTRDALRISGLNAVGTMNWGRLSADGELGLTGDDPDLDLAVELYIPDLVALEPLTKSSMQDYSGISVTAAAELRRKEGRARIDHLAGVIKGKGIRVGRVSGSLPDLSNWRSGSLAVDLELDHLGRLGQSLGIFPESKVPARLSLSLVGAKDAADPLFVSIEGSTEFLEMSVSGKLKSLDASSDFNLKSRLSTQDISKLSELVHTEIPITGPVWIEVGLSRDASLEEGFLNSTVKVNAEQIIAEGAGYLSWPLRKGARMSLHLETASLGNLRRWLPGEWLDPGHVSVDAAIEMLSPNEQNLNFSLQLGNNDLAGSAQMTLDLPRSIKARGIGEQKIGLVGAFSSTRLNLMEIFPAPKPDEKAAEREGALFSSEPLVLDWLSRLNVDLSFKASELITRKFKSENLSTVINIVDGVLKVDADSGEFSGGSFSLDFGIDSRVKPYKTDVHFVIDGLVVNQIPALQGVKLPLQGDVDLDIEISSRGDSLKEIASTASGTILASGRNTYFPASGMDFLTQSILAQILGVVNPKKKEEFHEVQCGVIGFRVVDGVVISRDTIALQSEDVTFLIRGGLSLADESIVFLIRPKARKGAGVSAATLTNFYRIGGTLSRPQLQADPEGVLKTGATWGLAAVTGGLSILAQGLFDKITGNQDVCAIAAENYKALLQEDGKNLTRLWKRLRPNGSN